MRDERLAEAHAVALNWLAGGAESFAANLGTGDRDVWMVELIRAPPIGDRPGAVSLTCASVLTYQALTPG